jgi:hypothetical protein
MTSVTHAEMSGYVARVKGVAHADIKYSVTIIVSASHADTSISIARVKGVPHAEM